MRFVTVLHQGALRVGLLEGETIKLLHVPDLSAVLGDLEGAGLRAGEAGITDIGSVILCAPIPQPRKILAIGLNYAAHVSESVSFISNQRPEVQKWFNKQATAANGPYSDVALPIVSSQLDYEGEMAVIIGKRGRHVPAERAMEIVAGVACGCDYSVRDWQKASPTMIMGKGFDTHAPFGPALVTLDELGDLDALAISTRVNGEVRQSAKLGDMIFSIQEQIAHLTAAFTLEPGDVIFTGTPAGVGAGFEPPKWLVAGDQVRVEIENVGHIENTIVRESGATVLE
ncbi:MAG: fumarylacetoacetate hydrolase family protein [Pseudomonadota bacterium]